MLVLAPKSSDAVGEDTGTPIPITAHEPFLITHEGNAHWVWISQWTSTTRYTNSFCCPPSLALSSPSHFSGAFLCHPSQIQSSLPLLPLIDLAASTEADGGCRGREARQRWMLAQRLLVAWQTTGTSRGTVAGLRGAAGHAGATTSSTEGM